MAYAVVEICDTDTELLLDAFAKIIDAVGGSRQIVYKEANDDWL